MRTRMFTRVFSALILTLTLNSLQADADLERTNLAKLVREIDYLMSRVDQIKQDAGTNQRVVFHYDDLRLDLKKFDPGLTIISSNLLRPDESLSP